jgi:hypothetical protein
MTKWEYHRETKVAQEDLDALGKAGWELVAISSVYYVFKRPLPEPLTMAPITPIAPC